jgi:hypothetical protein
MNYYDDSLGFDQYALHPIHLDFGPWWMLGPQDPTDHYLSEGPAVKVRFRPLRRIAASRSKCGRSSSSRLIPMVSVPPSSAKDVEDSEDTDASAESAINRVGGRDRKIPTPHVPKTPRRIRDTHKSYWVILYPPSHQRAPALPG